MLKHFKQRKYLTLLKQSGELGYNPVWLDWTLSKWIWNHRLYHQSYGASVARTLLFLQNKFISNWLKKLIIIHFESEDVISSLNEKSSRKPWSCGLMLPVLDQWVEGSNPGANILNHWTNETSGPLKNKTTMGGWPSKTGWA